MIRDGNKSTEYLGDSVYAKCVNGLLIIYLDNGLGPNSHIALEREVLATLNDYAKRKYSEGLLTS